MSLLPATDEARDALVGDLRRIRRLVPPEVPLPATRATIAGETVLLVDAADAAGWPGWHCAGAEHLAGPTDVLRRDDGHDVVVTDLAETGAHACGVREESGTGWHRGEVVTLVVSILRGVVEASQRGLAERALGGWWMTRDRRPVFVFAKDGSEGSAIGEASSELVRRIVAACDDRVIARACDDVLVALERPDGVERMIERFEQVLFDAAAPQPIELEPSRTRGYGAREPRIIRPDDADLSGPAQRLRTALESLLDARVAGAIAEAAGSVWRVLRRREPDGPATGGRRSPGGPERGRGRVALVAGSAAVVVVAVGVLWPVDDAGRAHERPDVDKGGVQTSLPVRDVEPGGVGGDDAAGTAEDAAVAESGEREAGALVGEDPVRAAHVLLADSDDLSGAAADPDAEVDLVDEYGAVALLAVSAAQQARQLLVIERVEGAWRVRDLYRQGSP